MTGSKFTLSKMKMGRQGRAGTGIIKEHVRLLRGMNTLMILIAAIVSRMYVYLRQNISKCTFKYMQFILCQLYLHKVALKILVIEIPSCSAGGSFRRESGEQEGE